MALLWLALLVRSEEAATATLWAAVQEMGVDVAGTLAAWGAPHVDVAGRRRRRWPGCSWRSTGVN